MKNKNYKGVEISTSYNEMSFCKEDGDVKTWVSDKKIKDLGKIISEELVTECKNWLLNDDEEMTEEDALSTRVSLLEMLRFLIRMNFV